MLRRHLHRRAATLSTFVYKSLSEGYQASVRRTAEAIPNVFPTNPGLESYRERTVTRSYKGSLVAGRRSGEWTVSDKTGHIISRGPFLNDEPHGDWTFRYRNGFTAQGAFEHSERIGAWTVRDPEGNVTTVRYEGGEQYAGSEGVSPSWRAGSPLSQGGRKPSFPGCWRRPALKPARSFRSEPAGERWQESGSVHSP